MGEINSYLEYYKKIVLWFLFLKKLVIMTVINLKDRISDRVKEAGINITPAASLSKIPQQMNLCQHESRSLEFFLGLPLIFRVLSTRSIFSLFSSCIIREVDLE